MKEAGEARASEQGEFDPFREFAPDRIIDGKYRLIRCIGSGGMGAVYEAEHVRLGRSYALKLLRRELSTQRRSMRSFEREAQVLAKLVHENIVSLFDAGSSDAGGPPYLVLERLCGRTLRAELEELGIRPLDRVLDIAVQVGRGLAFAHEMGVVHCDLKPENVFLTNHADGRLLVKLLDFGIARLQRGAAEPITSTDAGVGTAAYMAPEQARGERRFDARTDVYALGVIVYETLAGKRPYRGDTYNETLFQILNREHTPLAQRRPDLPARVLAAVERALAKSRDARFATVGELVQELGRELGPTHTPTLGGGVAALEIQNQTVAEAAPLRSVAPRSSWRREAFGLVAGTLAGAISTYALLPSTPAEPASARELAVPVVSEPVAELSQSRVDPESRETPSEPAEPVRFNARPLTSTPPAPAPAAVSSKAEAPKAPISRSPRAAAVNTRPVARSPKAPVDAEFDDQNPY